MKRHLFLAVLGVMPILGEPAEACDRNTHSISASCCEPPARWVSRYDEDEARFAINTTSGEATLLLTDDAVAIQLSDHALQKVHRKLRDAQREEEDNALGRAIKTAVFTGVRAILDHSAEISISDLSDVEYRRGRLIFTTEEGDLIFEDIDVGDKDVMRSFSERDAKAFVKEFQRLKARIG